MNSKILILLFVVSIVTGMIVPTSAFAGENPNTDDNGQNPNEGDKRENPKSLFVKYYFSKKL